MREKYCKEQIKFYRWSWIKYKKKQTRPIYLFFQDLQLNTRNGYHFDVKYVLIINIFSMSCLTQILDIKRKATQ